MNAHTRIKLETTVKMTSDGQIVIPEALREAGGLVTDGPVRVGLNDRGEMVVLPVEVQAEPTETREQRKARILAAIENLRGTIDLGGMTTDEYMREIRGDWEP